MTSWEAIFGFDHADPDLLVEDQRATAAGHRAGREALDAALRHPLPDAVFTLDVTTDQEYVFAHRVPPYLESRAKRGAGTNEVRRR